MFRNYWKIAWRTLSRHKVFSVLNILGLALGLTCSLLILLWVQDERSIDAFHVDGSRLFQLYERNIAYGDVHADYDTPAPLAASLKKTIPEVQYAVSTDWNDSYTFRKGDKTARATGGFASADFFSIFSFPLLAGNAGTALDGPQKIVLSRSMAVRFFGSPQAALGRTIQRDSVDHWKNFIVTAVYDIPPHSSLDFDFMIDWEDYRIEFAWMDRWENSGPRTFMVLKPGANSALAAEKIKGLNERFHPTTVAGHRTEFGIQRFGETYLHSRIDNGQPAGGRIAYVRLFTIVAIFILLIACINFMNLTTARSLKRAREIGVRKVIGASRSSLILQFLGEAVLLAMLAALLALLFVNMLLPLFNSMTDKQIVFPLTAGSFWGQLIALTLLTGGIAGSYPALFLSSFQPVKVLKGRSRQTGSAVFLRKGLVVFQFTLSTLLIIGTLVVARQLNYLQNTDIGFNRENLLYIPREGLLEEKYALFKQEALKLPGVSLVSLMDDRPTNVDNGTTAIDWDGKASDYIPSFEHSRIGYDFARTMGIQFKAGRDFSRDYPGDSVNYILNEAAVAKIGYKNPVGRSFSMWYHKGTIIGVIKNFHFASLHEQVKPMVLVLDEKKYPGSILVKAKAGQTPAVLAGLQKISQQLNPGYPFAYQFSDQEYQRFYTSEQIVQQLSRCFAALAIFISCLGLLGLALFTAEQRTKEIGIRKVLGADVGQLFILLSKDFLALVLLAFLVAAPLAAWAMDRWLADYAYHIRLPLDVFVLAGIMALGIALLTVAGQSLRAANANPVNSLHTE